MGPTTDAPTGADDSGAGQGNGPGVPSTLDALGRELLALRAIAAGLLAMIDAALTNYRLVQLGEPPRVTIEQGTPDPKLAANLADIIRRGMHGAGGVSGAGGANEVPRTFGDGKGRTRSTAPAPGSDTPEGVTTFSEATS